MIRQVVAIAAFLCLAYAAPFTSIEDIPAEYRGKFLMKPCSSLIPKEAKDFLTGLSDADKAVLKDIAKNYASYKNEDEALAALKEKSPELGEKAEKLHAMVKGKIDALGDEAKAFAKEIIAGARKIQAQVVAGNKPNLAELKEKAQSAINKYKALSDGAKEDLQKQFPILTSVFKNEKFQKMAETLLAKN
ncbi:nematode fatty acid retinoid binding protein [Ancylostoma caninum]|uniref:Fatty-acid and retinol-binding protein 1 n=1 Tax=Ancylostoma caninum TaxID=29170 RepID=A0A368FET5_ANCCA|nr:nematode fatty acid retinoid binding protein [Ancylostoma caninum]